MLVTETEQPADSCCGTSLTLYLANCNRGQGWVLKTCYFFAIFKFNNVKKTARDTLAQYLMWEHLTSSLNSVSINLITYALSDHWGEFVLRINMGKRVEIAKAYTGWLVLSLPSPEVRYVGVRCFWVSLPMWVCKCIEEGGCLGTFKSVTYSFEKHKFKGTDHMEGGNVHQLSN